VRDDALSVELRSSDEMIRYRAAARAFQELEPSAVSAPAREALLRMTADPDERAGVRLWAARAAAKLEPTRALPQFVKLASTGNAVVDDEAWIILGPVALPHLSARCRPDGCPLLVLTQIALIVGASSSHPASRATLPLLLLESTRSDQARALVYRALGSFGADLAPELERLQQHEDATVAAAASQALAAIQ
jgi:HEAT repeat protein